MREAHYFKLDITLRGGGHRVLKRLEKRVADRECQAAAISLRPPEPDD